MGSCNKAMWQSYGIYCTPGLDNFFNNSIIHPCDPQRKLYFMPDVPHLFKNIKQGLFNNKYLTLSPDIVKQNNLPSNIVYCKHIEALAEHQNDLELKLVRKINVEDFKPNHFDKMKVSKSTNMLSTEVSASLEYLVDNEGFDKSFKTTAWFVKQVLLKKKKKNVSFNYLFFLLIAVGQMDDIDDITKSSSCYF